MLNKLSNTANLDLQESEIPQIPLATIRQMLKNPHIKEATLMDLLKKHTQEKLEIMDEMITEGVT